MHSTSPRGSGVATALLTLVTGLAGAQPQSMNSATAAAPIANAAVPSGLVANSGVMNKPSAPRYALTVGLATGASQTMPVVAFSQAVLTDQTAARGVASIRSGSAAPAARAVSVTVDQNAAGFLMQWYQAIQRGQVIRGTLTIAAIDSSGRAVRRVVYTNALMTRFAPRPVTSATAPTLFEASFAYETETVQGP